MHLVKAVCLQGLNRRIMIVRIEQVNFSRNSNHIRKNLISYCASAKVVWPIRLDLNFFLLNKMGKCCIPNKAGVKCRSYRLIKRVKISGHRPEVLGLQQFA